MAHFVNKLDFNDQKYQSNESVRDDNYKSKLLFIMKDFVSFGTDRQLNVLYLNHILKR